MSLRLSCVCVLACAGSFSLFELPPAAADKQPSRILAVGTLFQGQPLLNDDEPKTSAKGLSSMSQLPQWSRASSASVSVSAADLNSAFIPSGLTATTFETLKPGFDLAQPRVNAEPSLTQNPGTDQMSFWRLGFTPNVFIPVEDGGRDFSETLSYGARFEAWNVASNITLVIEPSYRERGLTQTIIRDVPPQLQNQIPSEFGLDLDSQFFNIDLGLGYRLFDRSRTTPTHLATEFDIPSFSFDVMAGARLFFTWNDITGTTNLGQTATRSRQQTWAEPLVGGQLRLNLSDQAALLVSGDVSGFGIGDLSFSWRAKGAIDWRFAGNTSLLLGYQVSDFDYTITSGNDSLRYNILAHGPYVGLKLRF